MNSSTAGNASIFAPIFSGGVTFLDHSTAGSAFIVNSDNSIVQFGDSSTAGSATIFSEGEVSFFSSSKGGTAQIELLTGAVAIGDSFVFLKYASVTDGGFQILNPVFNHGTEQWSVAYLRNRAILTVEQHAPGVPDQGSTFLLLTLGLLGLVTYRRQLLRGQLRTL